ESDSRIVRVRVVVNCVVGVAASEVPLQPVRSAGVLQAEADGAAALDVAVVHVDGERLADLQRAVERTNSFGEAAVVAHAPRLAAGVDVAGTAIRVTGIVVGRRAEEARCRAAGGREDPAARAPAAAALAPAVVQR